MVLSPAVGLSPVAAKEMAETTALTLARVAAALNPMVRFAPLAPCEGANRNTGDPDRGAHKCNCAGARACAQRELVGRQACCCIGDREAARGERSCVGVCDGGGSGKGNAGLVLRVGDRAAAKVDDRHRTDLYRANVGRSNAITVAVERTDSAALVLGKEDDSAGCINQGLPAAGRWVGVVPPLAASAASSPPVAER